VSDSYTIKKIFVLIGSLGATAKIRKFDRFVIVLGSPVLSCLVLTFYSVSILCPVAGRMCENRGLCDTVLKFGMVLGQVMKFPNTIRYKLAHPLVDCCEIKNGRQTVSIGQLLLIASFFSHVFEYGESTFEVYFTFEVILKVQDKITVLQGERKKDYF